MTIFQAIFVFSNHESVASWAALLSMVAIAPVALAAFLFPKFFVPSLLLVAGIGMLALAFLIKFEFPALLLGWLRFFVPYLIVASLLHFHTKARIAGKARDYGHREGTRAEHPGA